jgi:radical SAM protein with 4Fe4S-binding SPASM domain
MVIKERFQVDVVRFEVDGIKMIGNNRTGSLIGLTEEGSKMIDDIYSDGEAEITETTEPLYEALKRGNYFKSSIKNNIRMASAYVHITDKCNLHCVGCYSYVVNRNKKTDLTYKEVCHVLDQLADNGVRIIVISGGEPFIREDIEQICQYAKGLDMVVQIITNGTMPHERYLRALPYIDAISVSVDGYQEDVHFIRDEGIMPKVLETVRFLMEHKAKVNLIFTLHRKNAIYMEEYMNLANNMGTTFNFSMLTTSPFDEVFKDYTLRKEEFDMVEHFLKHHRAVITDSAMEGESLSCKSRCGAGRFLISVSADGTIYPCHMLHIDDLKLGNIFEKDLQSIVFNEDNPFLNLDINNIEGCSECKYGNFCGGGYRARSYLASGSIYAKADICEVSYHTLDKNSVV